MVQVNFAVFLVSIVYGFLVQIYFSPLIVALAFALGQTAFALLAAKDGVATTVEMASAAIEVRAANLPRRRTFIFPPLDQICSSEFLAC
jgi:hypothetical protein